MADDPKTTMTPDEPPRLGETHPTEKGKGAEGWGDKSEPEKPQSEVAPGPGADGALPKVG